MECSLLVGSNDKRLPHFKTKKEIKSSVYWLQILSMYRAVTKRKLLMIREEYGLTNSSYPVQGIVTGEKKKYKHHKTLNFTSQGNGNQNH